MIYCIIKFQTDEEFIFHTFVFFYIPFLSNGKLKLSY